MSAPVLTINSVPKEISNLSHAAKARACNVFHECVRLDMAPKDALKAAVVAARLHDEVGCVPDPKPPRSPLAVAMETGTPDDLIDGPLPFDQAPGPEPRPTPKKKKADKK